jgi:hypothetical protein
MQSEVNRYFYSSSFQHLSDVQQRQVGAIVGASVADAAVRAVDEASLEAVNAAVEQVASFGSLSTAKAASTPPESEVVFLPIEIAPTTIPLAAPLEHHSLPHEAMAAALSVLVANKAATFPADHFAQQFWPLARTLVPAHGATFAVQASLLESAVTIPLCALYPYAPEDELRPYFQEAWRVLHNLPPKSNETAALWEPVEASQRIGESFAAVLTRLMMRNPDAIKNASFRAAPGTLSMFACAPGAARATTGVLLPTSGQAALQRAEWCLATVRNSRSFAEGVRACVRRGGPACQSALLVGACLGARFGPRSIPDEWMQATPGLNTVCQQAIELAQWSWNPPV